VATIDEQGGGVMAAAKKWHLVIDVARCSDCNNCFLADKDEFVGNDWPPYSVAQPWEGQRWMNIQRKERGQFPRVDVAYLPMPCMQCDEPPCAEGASPGAVYKREDGIVIIDPEKARGRREIVDACPYGAIYWNEEANVAQKCTGCAHLLDGGWTQTRCAQVCPTQCLNLVLADDTEMATLVKNEGLEVYRPELGTAPRVYYKNLSKWTKVFVAGSVVWGDSGECAEGARVVVSQGNAIVASAATNNFGDFCIDGLDAGGEFMLSIEAPGYKPVVTKVVPSAESLTLPAIFLEKL
jgi:Fe-S-cluster-containing dehydrogenase component